MFQTNRNWMMVALLAIPAMAQQYPPQQYPNYPQQQQQAAYYSPEQLDQLVGRIALYPDPLLAQIFAASTFPEQIQDAAQWADQHHYLSQDQLARAIQTDQYGFDPSIQALLPFPSVLQLMANDMSWTQQLGNAFLGQSSLLEDSVQRMRRQAYDNGYLRSNDQITVSNSGQWTEIAPANPYYIAVPYYDPAVVYYRPYRPGFRGGISFGYGVTLGSYFSPWGWGGGSRFAWDRHEVYVNNRVWDRRVYEERRNVTSYRPFGGYSRSEGHRYEQRGADYRNQRRGDYRPTPAAEQRRQDTYRQDQGRQTNQQIPVQSAPRPDVPRQDQGRPANQNFPAQPLPRPEMNRGQVNNAPPAQTPAAAPAMRQEPHSLEGRNDRERRAADSGRPSPRESHGREERRRN